MSVAQPFELTSSRGHPFRGDVHLPSGAGRAPAVVLCHGFKGFKDWGFFPHLADRLAEAGLAAVRFNFSMNGIGADPAYHTELDRFAANTIGQEIRDLDGVLSALRAGRLPGSERIDPSRTALFGHSRGGGIALIRALGDRGIRAVACWAPIPDFRSPLPVTPEEWKRQGYFEVQNVRTRQILRVGYEAWEDYLANKGAYDFEAKLDALRAPALFVHCGGDAVVPAAASRELARRAGPRATLRILEGGDHAFGAVHPFAGDTPHLSEALKETISFLQRSLM